MIKYLLLGLLAVLLFYLWRRPRSGGASASGKPAPSPPGPQSMVACAHCGVHLPASEALPGLHPTDKQTYFCSEDHRRAGPRAG